MYILNLRRVEFEFAHLFFHPIQKLYKSFIIHLLIRKVFSIIKQYIGCNRCRSILCFFFRFQSGCLKRNLSFPGNFKNTVCVQMMKNLCKKRGANTSLDRFLNDSKFLLSAPLFSEYCLSYHEIS